MRQGPTLGQHLGAQGIGHPLPQIGGTGGGICFGPHHDQGQRHARSRAAGQQRLGRLLVGGAPGR